MEENKQNIEDILEKITIRSGYKGCLLIRVKPVNDEVDNNIVDIAINKYELPEELTVEILEIVKKDIDKHLDNIKILAHQLHEQEFHKIKDEKND